MDKNALRVYYSHRPRAGKAAGSMEGLQWVAGIRTSQISGTTTTNRSRLIGGLALSTIGTRWLTITMLTVTASDFMGLCR